MNVWSQSNFEKDKMYAFLEQFILTILPRIKYFEGFSLKTVTHDGHFQLTHSYPLDCLLLRQNLKNFKYWTY